MREHPYLRANARGCPFCMASRDVSESLRRDLRELRAAAESALESMADERAQTQRRFVELEQKLQQSLDMNAGMAGEIRGHRLNYASLLETSNLVQSQRDQAWRENDKLRDELNRLRQGRAAGEE